MLPARCDGPLRDPEGRAVVIRYRGFLLWVYLATVVEDTWATVLEAVMRCNGLRCDGMRREGLVRFTLAYEMTARKYLR